MVNLSLTIRAASYSMIFLKKLIAASPKTLGSSKTEARSIPSATVDEDPTTDIFSPEFRPNNDSPSVGRLSTALQEILKDGLKELDKVAKRISVETGLSVPQVKERWRVKDGRTVSPWNIYQEYFGAHVEEELARLPKEAIKMGKLHKQKMTSALTPSTTSPWKGHVGNCSGSLARIQKQGA